MTVNGSIKNKIRSLLKEALSIVLCLMMIAGIMPQPAFAELSPEEEAAVKKMTSAEIKILMDKTKADLDRYTAEYTAADTQMKNAEAVMQSARTKIQPAKDNMDTAEWPLDQKSRQFMDKFVYDTWNYYDKYIFTSDHYTARRTVNQYKDAGMTYDNAYQFFQSDYRLIEAKAHNTYGSIIADFEAKYGAGKFEEVYTRALGYNAVMLALDHIDTCNAIRGDRTELAKYWVKVMGQSVPETVPQLSVSPSMMITSAMSAALNSSRPDTISHIYKIAGMGMQGVGQNAHSASGGSGKITDAFPFLWGLENSNGTKSGHNGNIAAPGYTVTGAALSNPNPYTGRAVFDQDFGTLEDNYKTYNTSEIRTKLNSFCYSELNTYNAAKTAYENAETDYSNARDEYQEAYRAFAAARRLKNETSSTYTSYEYYYRQKLKEEQQPAVMTYTVYFIDGHTNSTIKTQEVEKGGAATPPKAPEHEGYVFTGWDNEDYKHVTDVMVVIANYREASDADKAAASESRVPSAITSAAPADLSDVESLITGKASDADRKGCTFGLLRAKGSARSGTAVKLSWKRVSGAKSYVIYGNKCGKNNRYVKITRVTGTSFTHKKLRKGKYYKYLIVAVKGKKAIAVSKTIHVATKGGKVGNSKALKTNAKKDKVSLKKGRKFKLKAKAIPQSKKLKVRKHRATAFESSNPKIATVTGKGVIKAKKKGKCFVYAYTQNGVCKAIKVTVK